jgi:predicted XRE-type DNA-binding protein
MTREELIKLIQDNTMDSSEVAEYLGISKQRLSDMNRTGKLAAVKKGIYLREDVEKRKEEQGELREKYYRPSQE